MVQFSQVDAGYMGEAVVRGVSFTAPRGKVTALIGPNGCGKSTLLKSACGLLPLVAGRVEIGGKPLGRYRRKELARTCAMLPQSRPVPVLEVERLVAHGRYPHLSFGRDLTGKDREAVRWAMEEAGVLPLRGRLLTQLSGGERQRVYLALALAQDPEVFFLDEPTTYLDIGQKFELLELVRRINARGKTVVMVLHDLALAFAYSHYVALLGEGRLLRFGQGDEVFESGEPARAFGVEGQRLRVNGREEYLFTRRA